MSPILLGIIHVICLYYNDNIVNTADILEKLVMDNFKPFIICTWHSIKVLWNIGLTLNISLTKVFNEDF